MSPTASRRCAVCRAAIEDGVLCQSCRSRSVDRDGAGRSILRRTVEVLALESLSVPTEYQREERPHLVRKIMREFDPDLLGLLVVVRDRDGGQWILDGQHRWLALAGLGYQSAWCEVLHDVPLERQAEIFNGRNSRRISPHPLDAFPADYVARDANVLNIVSVLRRHGYRPPFGGHKGSADCFVCVSTLREVHAWGLLEPTVRLMHDTWPNEELATQAPILAGLAACIRLYPHASQADLRRKLSRHSAEEVLRLARAAMANSRERRMWVHVAGVVVEFYNHGRKALHRLDTPVIPYDAARRWKEQGS